jgi:RHS repeat-associated protein
MGPSDHVTTNLYDALNRPTQSTDGEGGTTSYTYINNDVLMTIGPAPTGENTKRRQMQYDSLNRVTSVCEVTSLTGAGTCSQTSAATGYWTKYAYGPANLITVTQNAQAAVGSQQTRTYNYDDIGRLTSETNPESGTTTYTYDVIPSGCYAAGTAEAGDLTQRQDPAGDNNCFIYDSLHRVTSVGSRTGCKRFAYDNGTVAGSRPSGVTTANSLGRMTEALTDNCSAWPPTPITDEWFSYTARGEVRYFWESTPDSGGYYPVAAAYWANGPLSGIVGAGGYSMTWAVDGEGRVSSAGSGSPLFGTTFNAASQPTQLSFSSSNTDGDTFTYDSAGRMKSYTFTLNSQSVTGGLTWNANGTLGSLLITDPFHSSNTQNCTYSHDDLVRIANVNCGASTWQQNFTYDPFGNVTKSVPAGGTGNSFQPTYATATNHINTIAGASVTYDANGDVTNDTNHTYTWDAFGNATTIDGNGIVYDALDRMVEQNRSSGNSEIIYSPTGFKLQIMNGASSTFEFVPLPAGGSVVYTPGGVYYRHPDWLGSSRLATTTSRTVLYDGAYAPFGEPYAQNGTPDYSFTGMNSDTSSGLYDFLYREYSTQGRWSSPDPAGLGAADFSNPQSWNRYSYVLNDPSDFTDSQGLFTQGPGSPPPPPPPSLPCNLGIDGINSDPGLAGDSTSIPCTTFQPWLLQNIACILSGGCHSESGGGGGPATNPATNSSRKKGCSVPPATAGQYASATGTVAAMTSQFASGLGPADRAFAPDSAVSRVMGQSGPVREVLNDYYMTGKTSDLYTFGGPGLVSAGFNPVAQFVGSFRWSISNGILTLKNTTSFRSLTYDKGPQWPRGPAGTPGFTTPMGNTHQIYNISLKCN